MRLGIVMMKIHVLKLVLWIENIKGASQIIILACRMSGIDELKQGNHCALRVKNHLFPINSQSKVSRIVEDQM